MKLTINILLTIIYSFLCKSDLKKFSFKNHLKSKMKFRDEQAKGGDKWTATGYKRGNPNDKSGTDWCKSNDDGMALSDCVKFWNPSTYEVFECSDKKNQNGLEVKCKKDGDTDQQEVYDGLPNIYEMDFCFQTEDGKEAKLFCERAECPNSTIQRIQFAQLGNSMGNCPNYYTDFLCHQDVMVSLEGKCKGLNECKVTVSEGLADKSKDLINGTTQPMLAQCDIIKAAKQYKLTVVISCKCQKQPGATGELKKAAF